MGVKVICLIDFVLLYFMLSSVDLGSDSSTDVNVKLFYK